MHIRSADKKDSNTSPDLLWSQFKGGSQEAYSVLYQQYFFYLLDYGKKISPDRELVKDAIQDLFIELWNRRTHLSDTSSIRFYLSGALKFKLYRTLDQTPVFFSAAHAVEVDPPWEEEQVQEEISQARQKKVHQALLQLLTKRQQEVIRLKFYQELDNDEIAANLQISKASVYNTVSKAMKVLRKNLDRAALVFSLLLNYL